MQFNEIVISINICFHHDFAYWIDRRKQTSKQANKEEYKKKDKTEYIWIQFGSKDNKGNVLTVNCIL